MSTHTPGKWIADVWDYSHATPPRKDLNIQTDTQLVATLQCDYTGDNPYTIPQTQAEANARLIAAAPELLEALRDLYALTEGLMLRDGSGPVRCTAGAMRAEQALAKAEGRG